MCGLMHYFPSIYLSLGKDFIHYIKEMPERCQAADDAKGGHTNTATKHETS
jgi:hypothetical protein